MRGAVLEIHAVLCPHRCAHREGRGMQSAKFGIYTGTQPKTYVEGIRK